MDAPGALLPAAGFVVSTEVPDEEVKIYDMGDISYFPHSAGQAIFI